MTKEEALAVIRMHQRAAPVDVIAIAKALGINVWTKSFPRGISGKIIRDARFGGPSGYSALVNAADPAVRQRFTLAHEIAHFILHRDSIGDELVDDGLYRSGLSNAQEAQANRLAAEILMPRDLMSQIVAIGHWDINSLASKLQVSKQALSIQLGM